MDLKNEFSWSKSRAGTFTECRRKYWFHYYGSWGGWEATSPRRVRDTYILKQLQTRWMWVGDVVHKTVEKILGFARGGRLIPEREAVDESLAAMRTDFSASRSKKYRERPKKTLALFEHEYDVPVTDDEWKEAAEHMRACVAQYYRSPYHEFLPKLPPGQWLPCEELDSYPLDGVKVWAKPDAAFRSGETTVEIVDWKTGRRDDAPDPLQLACYTAYALHKKWAADVRDVTTTEYNLSSGKAAEIQMTQERLDQVRVDISASAVAMKSLLDDPERNIASESKFPVTTDARACRSCNFRRLCPESPLGKEAS